MGYDMLASDANFRDIISGSIESMDPLTALPSIFVVMGTFIQKLSDCWNMVAKIIDDRRKPIKWFRKPVSANVEKRV
jgi:hypothetical protein